MSTTTGDEIRDLPLMAIVSSNSPHYWPVTLHVPPNGSRALESFIAMAELAIQKAVDLLGRGMPEPPPKVDDLLTPAVVGTLGKGETSQEYENVLIEVEARQTKLLQLDLQVAQTSIMVAADKDRTLSAIKEIVHTLNEELIAAGNAKLTPVQEGRLLESIAAKVQAVYRCVNAVYGQNEELANGPSGHTATTGSSHKPEGGASGGGDGSLASLLPVLLGPLMAAAPLVTQIPEMLQKAEEDKAKAAGEKEKDSTSPPAGHPGEAAPAAPPSGDPNASIRATTRDPNAMPVASASGKPEMVQPSATMPVAHGSYARARRDVRAGERPTGRQAAEPVDETTVGSGAVVEA
ncbi:hypothetical protein ACFZC5_36065 [Nocardia gamkensis]|uniref:hypothetical protein n=1 Tax=Nocardia gamkensis TaxID=352869 RepID=UPI0036F10047